MFIMHLNLWSSIFHFLFATCFMNMIIIFFFFFFFFICVSFLFWMNKFFKMLLGRFCWFYFLNNFVHINTWLIFCCGLHFVYLEIRWVKLFNTLSINRAKLLNLSIFFLRMICIFRFTLFPHYWKIIDL